MNSSPHTLGQDNYCAGCGFSYPCEGAWCADAERLAAASRAIAKWRKDHPTLLVTMALIRVLDENDAALAAHDALVDKK